MVRDTVIDVVVRSSSWIDGVLRKTDVGTKRTILEALLRAVVQGRGSSSARAALTELPMNGADLVHLWSVAHEHSRDVSTTNAAPTFAGGLLRDSPARAAAFTDPPRAIVDPRRRRGSSSSSSLRSSSFVVGAEDGTVTASDDRGRSVSNVLRLSSPIDVLLVHHEKRRVVVLSRSYILAQLEARPKTDGDGDGVEYALLSKTRLAVSSSATTSPSVSNTAWIAPGVLASATEETFLRVWDLGTDEHSTLPLAGGRSSRADRVTAIAFDPARRRLAAGDDRGRRIVVWTWLVVPRDGGRPRWDRVGSRPLPTTAGRSSSRRRVAFLRWGPRNSLVATLSWSSTSVPDEVVILNEEDFFTVVKY